MQNGQQKENDVLRVTLMKGIAILAVITIHVFSSLPPKVYTNPDYNFIFISLDQILRISVPIFIGLSGYALTKKYLPKLSVLNFYSRRISRLLPLYLLWCIGLAILFRFIPSWYTTAVPTPWWQVILLGRGDYHLYFVPLIVQFYLLFPLLLAALKRFPVFTFLVSLGIQLASLYFFAWVEEQPNATFLITDQAQYSLITSWISYFVMGMILAYISREQQRFWRIPALIVFVLSGYVMITQAVEAIKTGTDPLDALKFTRLVVLPYALSAIVVAITVSWEKLRLPSIILNIWKKIGEWSFILYLSHTLILRLIFATDLPGITSKEIVFALGFLVVVTTLSYFLEKK